jgi:hypothetical protein
MKSEVSSPFYIILHHYTLVVIEYLSNLPFSD